MAKRTSTTYLTPGEQVAGAVLFVIYLLVLPFATGPLFRLVEALLGTQLSPALENILYYYILFAVTVIVFHGFLGRTTRVLVDRAGSAGKVLLAGLVALYGLNELVYRLTRLVVDNRTNLNDVSISAQIDDAPRVTMLIVIFLAPFVEEVPAGKKRPAGLRRQLRAVCTGACVAVRGAEPGSHLFFADGAVSGAGCGAGLGV